MEAKVRVPKRMRTSLKNPSIEKRYDENDEINGSEQGGEKRRARIMVLTVEMTDTQKMIAQERPFVTFFWDIRLRIVLII